MTLDRAVNCVWRTINFLLTISMFKTIYVVSTAALMLFFGKYDDYIPTLSDLQEENPKS